MEFLALNTHHRDGSMLVLDTATVVNELVVRSDTLSALMEREAAR